ncbi:LysR family transcriptional regulator [Vibrio nigripulchritudo]|uniref:LysR family transcriptional regulator n=1 Tax=Vibrio nigripulchritudo TaxID=28173 RepID=UPI0003B1F86B|nr:LysR family transcriptional regulator [Vibrio nigripulchritudo]CCN70765.1 putative Transcriptional regulator, LysR family [Vibrio nigripulchritudo SFn118]
MNWTLDQIEAFVVSAQSGSFSAAARKLGKAQSRISSAIANLEADLGFELFDRSSRFPVVTPLGKQMLVDAEALLHQCHRLNSRALTASSGEPISLKLSVDEAIPLDAAHSIFTTLGERFPDLKLTITNGSRDDISVAIAEEKADIGLMFRHAELPRGVDFQSIGYFEKVLVVGEAHPLANRKEVSLTELHGDRQLVICDRAGEGGDKALTPNHWYIDSYYLICDLVAHNQGWAIVPKHIADTSWFTGQIKVLECRDSFSEVMVEIGLVKRTDSPDSEVRTWLMTELKELLEKNE